MAGSVTEMEAFSALTKEMFKILKCIIYQEISFNGSTIPQDNSVVSTIFMEYYISDVDIISISAERNKLRSQPASEEEIAEYRGVSG